MHTTHPNGNLRHEVREAPIVRFLIVYVLSKQIVLFLSHFDVEKGVSQLRNVLIPYDMRFGSKNIGLSL